MVQSLGGWNWACPCVSSRGQQSPPRLRFGRPVQTVRSLRVHLQTLPPDPPWSWRRFLGRLLPAAAQTRMEASQDKTHSCGTVCLKYLLLLFNILLWLSGSLMLALGVWTLLEQSVYFRLLSESGSWSWSWSWVSAVVLAVCGGVVLLSGVLGCCATLKERRTLLVLYLSLLLCLFLLELLAAALAFITYYQCFPFCYQLDDDQRLNLKVNMQQKYQQPEQDEVTQALDRLQQEFQCCGSLNSSDWAENIWIQSNERLVPDSCCKTPMMLCGRRDHPSNIYRVEGGCISKLEQFILQQLQLLTFTGFGVSALQLLGMIFTCCLYQHLKEDPY